MCHIRTMFEIRSKSPFAPRLQEKIEAHHGSTNYSPRNLLPEFREAAQEGLKLKIQETQCIVQQAVNYWQETRDTIDLLRINKNLSNALSSQETFILNQNPDHAFILENEEEEVSFRAMIHSIQPKYVF